MAMRMSGTLEEDTKPADTAAHIKLKVKRPDGNEVFFRMKRSTRLQKLMKAYCDMQSVDFNSIDFLFNGRCLRGEQTPHELGMKDGDGMEAVMRQTGSLSTAVPEVLGEFVNLKLTGN